MKNHFWLILLSLLVARPANSRIRSWWFRRDWRLVLIDNSHWSVFSKQRLWKIFRILSSIINSYSFLMLIRNDDFLLGKSLTPTTLLELMMTSPFRLKLLVRKCYRGILWWCILRCIRSVTLPSIYIDKSWVRFVLMHRWYYWSILDSKLNLSLLKKFLLSAPSTKLHTCRPIVMFWLLISYRLMTKISISCVSIYSMDLELCWVSYSFLLRLALWLFWMLAHEEIGGFTCKIRLMLWFEQCLMLRYITLS